MINDGRLRRRGRANRYTQPISPIDGVANLADIMLVFACGLMIALILHWNVDLKAVVDVISQEDLVEVKDMDKLIEGPGITSDYESKGMVFEDVETGKMYIISP